jgi:hypothetical protein
MPRKYLFVLLSTLRTCTFRSPVRLAIFAEVQQMFSQNKAVVRNFCRSARTDMCSRCAFTHLNRTNRMSDIPGR